MKMHAFMFTSAVFRRLQNFFKNPKTEVIENFPNKNFCLNLPGAFHYHFNKKITVPAVAIGNIFRRILLLSGGSVYF